MPVPCWAAGGTSWTATPAGTCRSWQRSAKILKDWQMCIRDRKEADVLCGYTAYVALAAAQFPDKETYATGMRAEIKRCRWALETAAHGKTVALVCLSLIHI